MTMMDVDDLDPVDRQTKTLVKTTPDHYCSELQVVDGKGRFICMGPKECAEFIVKLVNERYAQWLEGR